LPRTFSLNPLTSNNKEAIEKTDKEEIKRLREQLILLHGRYCCWCNRLLGLSEEITIEHLLSRCRGGNNELNNLAIACKPCNNNRETYLRTIFKDPHYIACIEHEQRIQVQYHLEFNKA